MDVCVCVFVCVCACVGGGRGGETDLSTLNEFLV